MKKLFTLIAVALFSGMTLFAQNIVLSNLSHPVANGDTVKVYGSSLVMLSSHVDVTNTTSSSDSIICRRFNPDTVLGSTNSICWGGSCWPIGVSVTPPEVIAAGATVTVFSGDYNANGYVGTSYIRYTFFNKYSIHDTVCFVAEYNASLGINESDARMSSLDVYPNPANSSAVIKYSVGVADASARIVISNLLGKEIITLAATEKEGLVKFETDNLCSGLYFYSFVTGNKVVATKKFVVNHK
ncbi:MAG: T9SS type A sorting domain-containing protein [Bacteroidota bacterium]